jgi:hypothetical protein
MHGIGFEDNFRAGKISCKKAALSYEWIRSHIAHRTCEPLRAAKAEDAA